MELQKRNDDDGNKNSELQNSIQDLEYQIRKKEEQTHQLKKELDGARYSNSALLDNNSNLQVEIEALNAHIKVLSKQNDDLTKELDHFVEANEQIRQRLDRKNRVHELRSKNETELKQSLYSIHGAKSPNRN